MITLLSLVSFAAWIYLIGFRGAFWRSDSSLEPKLPSCRPRVTVVVPARDEAQSIRQSLSSLLSQDYPGEFSVILVDDNSSDGTGDIAASLDGDGRLIVLQGEPLRVGWTGKLWAVHQGLAHEAARTSDYLFLTDADVVHSPGHIAALVAKAETDRLDLVSEMVRLNCETRAERALIPAFVYFFQMLYPFKWVAEPDRSIAGAAGGTMLIRRATLDRIDGLTRIREQLIDDCALAKEVKSTGGRIWLGHADRTVSLRVYSSWREVWNMIARTAYVQLRYSLFLLLGCVVAMILIFCAPPALAMLTRGLPRVAGFLAWVLMAISFQPTLNRYHRSPLWGPVLPVISLFYVGATVASAALHYIGRGGAWKDRVYPRAPAA
jgi:hopene-associated glycosyltransferase HpnB